MLENTKISTAEPQPGTGPQAPRDVLQPQLALKGFLNECLTGSSGLPQEPQIPVEEKLFLA